MTEKVIEKFIKISINFRYRRQTRALERASGEAGELRLQLRDLRAQLAAAGDYKVILT